MNIAQHFGTRKVPTCKYVLSALQLRLGQLIGRLQVGVELKEQRGMRFGRFSHLVLLLFPHLQSQWSYNGHTCDIPKVPQDSGLKEFSSIPRNGRGKLPELQNDQNVSESMKQAQAKAKMPIAGQRQLSTYIIDCMKVQCVCMHIKYLSYQAILHAYINVCIHNYTHIRTTQKIRHEHRHAFKDANI